MDERHWQQVEEIIAREVGRTCAVTLTPLSKADVKIARAEQDHFLLDRIRAGITLYKASRDAPLTRHEADWWQAGHSARSIAMTDTDRYRAAVYALPPLTRLVFLLRRGLSLSYTDIGNRLSLDVDTVMDYVAEALWMIDQTLEGRHPQRFDLPEAAARIAAAEARMPIASIDDAFHRWVTGRSQR